MTICVAVFGFFTSGRLVAQTYTLERVLENRIVDAANDISYGKYRAALSELTDIVRIDPKNDAAHYYRGMASYIVNDLDTAEKELRKAVELDSTNFWYRYRLAAVYAVTDREELTAQIYNDLLKDFPDKTDLYYGLVNTYLTTGKLDEALETLDKIETLFGKSEMAEMTRFDVLRNMNRHVEAYEALEEYNKEYSSPQVLSMLGDYQMSMYNDSTALALYDEALDIAPGYAPALLGKGEVYRMTRRYDDYFVVLNEFVSDEQLPVEGKCDYLRILIQRSDPKFLENFRQQLDETMSTCLRVHPKDSLMTELAGLYYYNTNRVSRAKECFKENLDNWPDSPLASADYAEILMYSDGWGELSEYARSAYDKFPDSYRYLEMAILADYNLKDYDAVIQTCERLISMAPDSSTVLSSISTLGDMYYKKGESAKAYKAYETALRIDPQYTGVLNNYAYYLSLEGKNLKKAAAMSKITVEKEPDNPTYLDTYGWILFLQGKPEEAKAYFKHAMLYGGKDNAVILDHYAEVLYALKEYDLAFVYWNQALSKDTDSEVEGLEKKIKEKRAAIKNK